MSWNIPDYDSMKETIQGHFDSVYEHCGEWPINPPEPEDFDDGANILSSWSYVSGYANGLGLTPEQLFAELEVKPELMPPTDVPCPKCGGKLRPCSTGAPDYHCDACVTVVEAQDVAR